MSKGKLAKISVGK